MKSVIVYLFSSARAFLSSLIPFLFVVGIILLTNLMIVFSRGLIYVNKAGKPLETNTCAGERSVRAARMSELTSDLFWNTNPAKLAEYDRLSSTINPDAIEIHLTEKGAPSSEPLPATQHESGQPE